jgi:putative transcriptional regulator
MTITHHPPEELLADFATGKLDEAEQLVVSVHTAQCEHCRRFVKAVELLAGRAIENVEPVAMSSDAFDAVMAQIATASNVREAPKVAALTEPGDAELPEIIRRRGLGKRRSVAPGVSLRPILLAGSDRSRAFLLQSAPGARMLEHTHTGSELTCVLKGSFSHKGGRYGPGDFDFGDESVDHRPIVGDEGPCLCVVAMTGDLRMNGLLGRLINPFVRL